MKKFKLLVAMLAAAFGFSVVPMSASAEVADTKTSDAKVGFTKDGSALLRIDSIPAIFDFGINAISAINIDPVGPNVFLLDPTGDSYDDEKANEAVKVWDGRVTENDWTLSVQLTEFTDVSNGNTLAGAEIEISGITTTNTDTVPDRSTASGVTSLKIGTTATTDILKANDVAKAQSSLDWELGGVKLIVPGAQLKYGNFTSTITWTLAGTPEA